MKLKRMLIGVFILSLLLISTLNPLSHPFFLLLGIGLIATLYNKGTKTLAYIRSRL